MQTHQTSEQELAPFQWYRTMRQKQPVFYDKQTDAWHVFRYEDVARILTDNAAFYKFYLPPDSPYKINPILSSVIEVDPLRHRLLHNIVMQAFTPQVMVQLEARVSKIINRLLDQAITGSEMDVMTDLAYPLPVSVIADLLGVPEEQHTNFKTWCDEIKRDPTAETLSPAVQQMCEYFRQMLAERRKSGQHPQNDLISALVAAEINGQHLSDDELRGFCVVLLASGTNSVTSLIGNAILCFDEHPEVMDRLRAEPALMSGAIEEVLRYRAPVQALRRTTMKEITLSGQLIGPQKTIIAWTGSANHDEAQFPDPEHFDIQRQPNRHLAFAHGIHFCVGAPLARLEVKILLNALLERLSNLRCSRDIPLALVKSPAIFALTALPVTFVRDNERSN